MTEASSSVGIIIEAYGYGLTLHNVLRVREFTADGEAIEFGSDAPDVAGLDLLPLVVGSEGRLAVIIEVAVRLLAVPSPASTALVSRNSTPCACSFRPPSVRR